MPRLEFIDNILSIKRDIPEADTPEKAARLVRQWADANFQFLNGSRKFTKEHPELLEALESSEEMKKYEDYLRSIKTSCADVPSAMAALRSRYRDSEVMREAVDYFNRSIKALEDEPDASKKQR